MIQTRCQLTKGINMNTRTLAENMWPEAQCNSLLEMEEVVNANFVTKIMLLTKEEELSRKELMGRLNVSAHDYLSKDNMKKIFLRSFARAFNKLYGEE